MFMPCGTEPNATLFWLKDETFYSLCSRQHAFLGHVDTATTLAWLYGSSRCAITHDFPGNLIELKDHLRSCWGDPPSIIHEHTILPLFRPFQSHARIQAAVEAMESPSIGSIKFQLGLLTSRFGAEHPLKACTSCMAEDRTAHGVAYWHLSQQFPGVILCPTHCLLLSESALNRQWSGRFRWVLPDEEYLQPSKSPVPTDHVLAHFGSAVLELVASGRSVQFDPSTVCGVYRTALSQLGTSRTGQKDAAASFVEHTSRLQIYPPLTSLPTTFTSATAFIAQMTRKPRGHLHPLKHLTFITWLFGHLASFIQAYECLANQPTEPDRSVARRSDSTSSILDSKWGSPTNQYINRKPKKLKPPIRDTVIKLLRDGEHKEPICSRFNVTICTVNRILRSEPGLLELWAQKQRDFKISEHRTEWTRAIAENPELCTKKLREIAPKTYAWLYRNDRAWFITQKERLPSGRCGNSSNVDWDQRDRLLLTLVESKLVAAYGNIENSNIKRRDIYKLVPSLFRSLETYEHYPRTRALLAKIASGPS